jgi:hypothetical protein
MVSQQILALQGGASAGAKPKEKLNFFDSAAVFRSNLRDSITNHEK